MERHLSTKKIYDGKILSVRVDTVELENGAQATREIIDHNGAAGIVALDDKGRLLLVRQYRYAIGREMLEIPAGKRDGDEAMIETAARELEEETGCRAARLIELGEYYPAAAYDRELLGLFYADGLTAVGQHLDEDEFLTVEAVDFDEAVEWALSGKIQDSKTIIGILRVKALRESGKL
ncbi:MAG: NUDIX hydrolase [Clostridia bacterium]|nr:NUDIX hydrolase [Clostridia bacterium]